MFNAVIYVRCRMRRRGDSKEEATSGGHRNWNEKGAIKSLRMNRRLFQMDGIVFKNN